MHPFPLSGKGARITKMASGSLILMTLGCPSQDPGGSGVGQPQEHRLGQLQHHVPPAAALPFPPLPAVGGAPGGAHLRQRALLERPQLRPRPG